MTFIEEYLLHLATGLIPLSLGTLVIVLSGFLKKHDRKLSLYGFTMGVIISLLSLAPVVLNFLGILGQIL